MILSTEVLNTLSIFILIVGFVIGLGAVTVIDIHGFLGRRSSYWTETTIRTHKVTKPLIWIGMMITLCGAVLLYRDQSMNVLLGAQCISAILMVLNGIFLSFRVSPFLLNQEKTGRASELLPSKLQLQIAISFVISFVCWWGNAFIFSLYIGSKF